MNSYDNLTNLNSHDDECIMCKHYLMAHHFEHPVHFCGCVPRGYVAKSLLTVTSYMDYYDH